MNVHTLVRFRNVTISGAILVAAISVVAFTGSNTAHAQTGGSVNSSGATQSGTGDNLKISPLRSDVTAEPGKTIKKTIYIQNMNPVPVKLKVINNDFVAGNKENGEPSIVLDENKFAPTHSLKRFMQPISAISLKAGERKPIDVTITIPKDAQAGGYYGALRFAPVNAEGSGNVNLSGGVASLILLTVPGNITEKLTVREFGVQQNGKYGSRFSTKDNIQAVIRLENRGNVQVAPFGEVFVQKGDKLVYSAKFNNVTPAGVVLPDSIRKWSVPIEKLDSFGKYKISTTLGYGGNGESITVVKTIWIFPTAYIFAALIAILVIIGGVALTVVGLKSYKNKILRNARRR